MTRLGYPTYRMFVQHASGEDFLLAARRRHKVSRRKGQSFLISRVSDDLAKGPNYVAKLRSNFLATQWVLYDSGLKPHEVTPAQCWLPAPAAQHAIFDTAQSHAGASRLTP